MYKKLFVGAIASLLACGVIGTNVQAQSDDVGRAAGSGCKNKDLKGSYAFVLLGNEPAPGLEPFAGLRTVSFDGKGKWKGAGPRIAVGQFKNTILKNGTYTVESDCTVDLKYDVFDLQGNRLVTSELFAVMINANKVAVLLTADDTGSLGTFYGTFEKMELAR